jgi:uncharacterized protein YndB with AHSA1/START domain
MTAGTTLRMERTFPAPAQSVFDAWTSEEVIRRWWHADGATTVRLTHRGLWDEEAVRSHEDGWGRCFDNLERTLGA